MTTHSAMFSLRLLTIGVFTVFHLLGLSPGIRACAVGSANDYQVITNPIFTMQISPPVGWTYFPTAATVGEINYFVGQSNTSAQAQLRANSEITSGMIQAMVEANLIVNENTAITNNWTPISIENLPSTGTITASEVFGHLEAGAITGTLTGITAVPTTGVTYTPYMYNLIVTVRNAQSTRYEWNIVKNNFVQFMTLQFNMKFWGTITISDDS